MKWRVVEKYIKHKHTKTLYVNLNIRNKKRNLIKLSLWRENNAGENRAKGYNAGLLY
jgi:hypothetical protein